MKNQSSFHNLHRKRKMATRRRRRIICSASVMGLKKRGELGLLCSVRIAPLVFFFGSLLYLYLYIYIDIERERERYISEGWAVE